MVLWHWKIIVGKINEKRVRYGVHKAQERLVLYPYRIYNTLWHIKKDIYLHISNGMK